MHTETRAPPWLLRCGSCGIRETVVSVLKAAVYIHKLRIPLCLKLQTDSVDLPIFPDCLEFFNCLLKKKSNCFAS